MFETLERRKKELAAKIKAMAKRFDDNGKAWKDEAERTAWDEANRDFDKVTAEIESRYGIPGLDNTGTRRAMDDLRGDDLAVSLASWVRNASGEPVTAEDFQRSIDFGRDPRAASFDISFRTGPPTMGFRALGTVPGASGGFTVPSSVVTRLESAMKQFGPMLQTSEVWITDDGREANWPTIDDTSNQGSQVGENTDVGEATDLEFRAKAFRAYKMSTGVLKASHEILRDSAINVSNAISDKLGERLGRIVNQKATTGTGAATLKGIVTESPAGKTAASATAITFDELIELQHAVDPAYRVGPGVGWMMNDTTAGYVRRLKDNDNRYLWTDSQQQGQPAMLLGFPVYINQDMGGLTASTKAVLFGQLTAYKLRIVRGIRMRNLVERYAEYDQTGFIGFLEVDGGLLKASATDALSPVQALRMAAA